MRADLLDLLGKEYLLDHCFHFRNAELEKIRYQAYITDALRVLAEGKIYRDEIERWVDLLPEYKKQRAELKEGEAKARILAKLRN